MRERDATDPTVAFVLIALHNMHLLRHDAIEGFTAQEWREQVHRTDIKALDLAVEKLRVDA